MLFAGIRYCLKILNPFIWCINVFRYACHMEAYRLHPDEYERYDFSHDISFF